MKAQSKKAGEVLLRLINASNDARRPWSDRGRPIWRNFSLLDRRDGLPYQKSQKSRFTFNQRLPMVSQGVQVFLPKVSLSVGEVKVSPAPGISEQRKQQLSITQELLNRSTKVTGAWEVHRAIVTDMLIWGRGICHPVYDPESGYIVKQRIDPNDFIIDPDASSPNKAAFQGYLWRVPRWELLQWGEGLADEEAFRKKVLSLQAASGFTDHRSELVDKTIDVVEVYRIYCYADISNYFQTGPIDRRDEVKKESESGYSPRMYLITPGGEVIYEGGWDIPFFVNKFRRFPFTLYDAPTQHDIIWPDSIFAAGMPYLDYMNWLICLLMGKSKVTMRLLMAMRSGAGTDPTNRERIWNGQDLEILDIKNGAGKSLKEFIETFEWSHEYLSAGMGFYRFLEDKFERATGLYGMLYTGDIGRQMRTANEAELYRQRSEERIADLRNRVIDAENRDFYRQSFAMRYLFDSEDVGKILTPEAATGWGFLSSDGANFEEIAAKMVSSVPGVDPMRAQMLAAEVSAQLMSRGPVTIDEWAYAADYSVDVSSTYRQDMEYARATGEAMMNQPFAAATKLAASFPPAAPMPFVIMRQFAEMSHWPDDYISDIRKMEDLAAQFAQAAMQPPPPPPPVPAAGPVPGMGGEQLPEEFPAQ